MNAGFFNSSLLVSQRPDGINFNLQEHLYFYSVKWGWLRTQTSSDGGSIPEIFWNIIPPIGRLLWSYVLHDGAYQNHMEQLQPSGDWVAVTFAEIPANDLLAEAGRSQGANEFEIATIYHALNWFGWRAFNEDRKQATINGMSPIPLATILAQNPDYFWPPKEKIGLTPPATPAKDELAAQPPPAPDYA